MSEVEITKPSRPFARPSLTRNSSGPNRSVGGFYRTAESKATALGGIPLQSAEDAVVAAVRMAYKVAEAQVDRSTRLARRLRAAGDRAAGPGSERQAVDAAERLVFRTMMGGLSWLEGAAAERESPLRRILAAEYRMLGSVLGLTPITSASTIRAPTLDDPSARIPTPTTQSDDRRKAKPSARFLNIVHKGQHQRMVHVAAVDISAVSNTRMTVQLYNATQADALALPPALLVVPIKGVATLEIQTPLSAPPGLWRAAVCNSEGLQLGSIEIVL